MALQGCFKAVLFLDRCEQGNSPWEASKAETSNHEICGVSRL